MKLLPKFEISRKQFLSIILIVGIFVAGFFSLNIFDTRFQGERMQSVLKSAGLFAPILYIVIYVITLILAPVTGYPLYIAGIGLFGIVKAVILSYIASLISATVNFYIAHFFGRPILKKFVGKKGLEKIDNLSTKLGIEALILGRLFQAFLFEWISYAAGLTQIKFKTYFLITAVAPIPLFLASIFLGTVISDLGTLFVVIAVLNYLAFPIPFLYFGIKKFVKNRKAIGQKE